MADVVLRGPVTGPRRLGQLPAEASSFVGRAAELTGIAALLAAARMVTVTGTAGVGKTRVSLRAATAAADQFPDGAWLVDLAPVTDPGQLAAAVATALGLPQTDETALHARLRGRRLLLILDTCEHLVDACAAFADALLRAAPGVTLLATSRQPLDAQGEHAFPVLPLSAEADAAELFGQRAAAVVPGFAVTPRNRPDVVRLCRLLDGIPLAIELAAVRLRALPLPELASQLESGMGTLALSRRGSSPRHQTLRAAVQWSYDLCTEAEQALWERLSVFRGSFDAAGAEQVCAGGPLAPEQVIHTLIGLVDKSVLRRDDTAPARYLLPGAAREFGAERLAAADERERYHSRLMGYCLATARRLDEPLRAVGGGDQAAAVRGLRAEHANLTGALDFALGPGDAAGLRPEAPAPADLARQRLGAGLAVRLTGYWLISGLVEDGGRWLGRAADALPQTAQERMRALAARGRLATFRGDLAGAIADIEESIRLAGQHDGAVLDAGRGYLYLNLALTLDGRFDDALRAGEMARELLTECDGRFFSGGSGGGVPPRRSALIALEGQLGYLHQLAGEPAEAIACCDRGLAMLADDDRERWLSGYLHLVTGLAETQQPGREQASAASLSQALTAAHELGDVVGMAYAIETTGWQAARRGRHERAAWLLGAADRLWAKIGCRLSGSALAEESRQRAAGTARAALGERRYSAACSHGGALDLAAVVAGASDPAFDPRVQRGVDPVPADGGPGNAGTGAAPHAPGPAAVLTRREREIADLVATGLSNREVADRLFISKRTVDAHVEHIFGKLGISSRVQLTVLVAGPPSAG